MDYLKDEMKMRKVVFCFILLVMYFQSCQSQTVRIKYYEGLEYLEYEKKKEQSLWTGIYEDKLIEDGIWIQLFKEDTLKAARIFGSKDQLFDGIWKEFYFSGQINREGEYRIGKKHGVWKEWYNTGQLKKEEYFVEGKLNGKSVSYYPDGIISYLSWKNHSGKDSLWVSYHKNGNISRNLIYSASGSGIREKIFYSNKQIYTDQTQIYGLQEDTIQTYYHSNGIVLASGRTKNNARIGLWKFFYKNGQLKAEGKYSQDTKQYCNNTLNNLIHYHFKTGKWSYWYEDGKLMAKGRYEPIMMDWDNGGFSEKIQVAKKESDWQFQNQKGEEITESELSKMGLFKEYPPLYFTGEIEP